MSSSAATATRQFIPVIIWTSSIASTLAGSAIASSTVSSPMNPTGTARKRRAVEAGIRFAAPMSTE